MGRRLSIESTIGNKLVTNPNAILPIGCDLLKSPRPSPRKGVRRDPVMNAATSNERDTETAIARLKFKKEIVSKKIREQTTAIFVGLIEDIPFYVMNMIAILNNESGNNDNIMFLISLSITAMSVGFKVSVGRELFGNLGAKGDINDQIEVFRRMSRSLHKVKSRISVLQDMPLEEIDDKDEKRNSI